MTGRRQISVGRRHDVETARRPCEAQPVDALILVERVRDHRHPDPVRGRDARCVGRPDKECLTVHDICRG